MKTNLKNWSQGALKGFTLIELLIVITIIGILAVALLPSVLGAPARARDAARKADLNNIVAGLETYNSDNQKYPDTAGNCSAVDGLTNFSQYFQGGKIPKDPQTGSYLYCGVTGNGSVSYYIVSKVEIAGDGNAYYASAPSTSILADVFGGATIIDQCKPKKSAAANDCNYYLIVK
ncbi:MAG: prepilin-type N-terminal cleavage/methylation domain-containing protein [Candidatus Gracilibacteria bacterium]|jgi:general secretion pathway protein G